MGKKKSFVRSSEKAKRTVIFRLSSQVLKTVLLSDENGKTLSKFVKEEKSECETSFEIDEKEIPTETEQEHCMKNYGVQTFEEALEKIFNF